MSLPLIELGDLRIANPSAQIPAYLSAASGVGWTGRMLHAVGDDQVTLLSAMLPQGEVYQAFSAFKDCSLLHPGTARRIIPGDLPQDPGLAAEHKPDFEALVYISHSDLYGLSDDGTGVKEDAITRFPHGLLLITGSGGVTWGGRRRSKAVVYPLDGSGNAIGIAAPIDFEGLHAYLESHVLGELNIEGSAVWNGQLILAQRGNCIDEATMQPGDNMLIRLSLNEVMRSICNDLKVDSLELLAINGYNHVLGTLPVLREGEQTRAKLDFTDLVALSGDPRFLVFTAAAEEVDGPHKGSIAGSVVGVLHAESGEPVFMDCLEDPTIKLEGIEAWFNWSEGRIEFLAVDDADNPENIAKLRGGIIRLP